MLSMTIQQSSAVSEVVILIPISGFPSSFSITVIDFPSLRLVEFRPLLSLSL